MDHGWLFPAFVFLAASCIVVPVVERFKLGSVLGYLIAGVLIGPFGFGIIGDAEAIMHFAEFGVVMMLFVIGLEIDPAALWRLRKAILGLGGLQVLLTSVLFSLLGMGLGFSWQLSLAVGMALSLSSTALVLQMLEEKGLLHSNTGESAFAVLLFQDMAVIPILLLLPLLGTGDVASEAGLLAGQPEWLKPIIVASAILVMIAGGRYLSRHLFRFIAKTNLRELFTAISLALVVGITLLMESIGVSPALGAFIAGVVLASSEYRHTLEADIEPFKALLLGLFFIAIGMGMDFSIAADTPVQLAMAVGALVVIKAVVLGALAYIFGLRDGQAMTFLLALAQGGEFAFVLFQYALDLQILSDQHSAFLTLVVAISIGLTPLLMILNERFFVPRFMSVLPQREYDAIDESNPVIIAGYGRFGQVIGRFLSAQGVGVTVLEKDPDQIELLRKFDSSGYFGDASRLDLLHSARADKAKLLVVAVDDPDKCLEIVHLAKEHFPNLTILARARNRRHAYELHKAGVDYFRREMFDASLRMAQEAMKRLGADPAQMRRKAAQFRKHDESTLRESFAFFDEERELISFARQSRGELERLLRQDVDVKHAPPATPAEAFEER